MKAPIVAAVDDSPEATEAGRVAAMLARQLGRQLVLIHVADDPPVFPCGDSRLREIRRRHTIERSHSLLDDVALAIGDEVGREVAQLRAA